MNPDWDGRMKAEARKPKSPRAFTLETFDQTGRRLRICRIALEAIYGTPELTLAEARVLAGQALEDTE